MFLCMELSMLHYVNYFRVLYFVVGSFLLRGFFFSLFLVLFRAQVVSFSHREIASPIHSSSHKHRHKDTKTSRSTLKCMQLNQNVIIQCNSHTHSTAIQGVVCRRVLNVKHTKLEHQPESLYFFVVAFALIK